MQGPWPRMKRFVGLLNLHCIVVISDLYQRDLVFFRNQGLFTEILTVKEQEWKMLGTSLAVHCLRLWSPTVRSEVPPLFRELRSHVPLTTAEKKKYCSIDFLNVWLFFGFLLSIQIYFFTLLVFFSFIGVSLIYNVRLVPDVQHSESITHIDISTLF